MRTELVANICFTEEEYNIRTKDESCAPFDEFIDAARCFGKLSNKTSVHSRYQRFRAVCMSWLSFMKAITGKEKELSWL